MLSFGAVGIIPAPAVVGLGRPVHTLPYHELLRVGCRGECLSDAQRRVHAIVGSRPDGGASR